VRSKVRRADRSLEDALAALASALNASGAAWTIVGSVAVIARGVRRMTTDLSAIVLGDDLEVAALLRALARKGIVPRIDDAEKFADENFVLLLAHEPTGIEIDVSVAWTDFERDAIESSSVSWFGAVQVLMPRPDHLIALAVIAGRPQDRDDATALLVLYPEIDRRLLRARVRELAELAEEPGLVSGLDAAIGASDKSKHSRRGR
jgi:hypothetical protein